MGHGRRTLKIPTINIGQEIRNNRKELFFITILYTIPNVLLFIFNANTDNSRPAYLNVDYLVPGLAYVAMRRWIGHWPALVLASVLLTIALAADCFVTLSDIYFADHAMIVDYLPFISLWPWRWMGIVLAGFVAGALILCVATLKRSSRGGAMVMALAVLFGLSVAADVVWRVAVKAGGNGASSAVLGVAQPSVGQIVNEMTSKSSTLDRLETSSLWSDITVQADPPARILSISVESWGVPKSAAARAELENALLLPLRDQYVVQENGSRPYYGATLAGEIRELCGLRLVGGVPKGADQYQQLNGCLPAALQSRGYVSTALHGNVGTFYRRTRFYPLMGFSHAQHYEQMRAMVPALCTYTFIGICDRDAARIAVESFGHQPREFVHLMTLDTHFPLPAASEACRRSRDSELCTYLHEMSRSLGGISQAIETARYPPDMIVLYGDHGPPFTRGQERDQFESGRVPYMVLKRKVAPGSSQAVNRARS